MKLTQVTINLSDGSSFDVWMSHPEFAEAAAMNWEVRTKTFTPKSFTNYINIKRFEGKTDHHAFTSDEIAKLTKK